MLVKPNTTSPSFTEYLWPASSDEHQLTQKYINSFTFSESILLAYHGLPSWGLSRKPLSN